MSDKGSKTVAIVIFVSIAVALIGYTFYVFEAFKNDWWPFTSWDSQYNNIPENAIRPLGKVELIPLDPNSGDEEVVTANILEVLEQNSDWYGTSDKPGDNRAIPLAGGVKPLAPSD